VPAPFFTSVAAPNCAGSTSVVPARSNRPPESSAVPAMLKVTGARDRMSAVTSPFVPPNCACRNSASVTVMFDVMP